MACKNIKKNQEKMSIISLKISVEIEEFVPEIVVAALVKRGSTVLVFLLMTDRIRTCLFIPFTLFWL